jgi:urease accessory protein
MIIIEIEPENVAMLKIKHNIHEDADDNNHILKIAIMVGHTLGNLHRPIRVERNTVYFPIQADNELQMFRKLFVQINEHLDIINTKMIFEPEEVTQIREH